MFRSPRLGLSSMAALTIAASLLLLAQEPKEISGAWTAELRNAKVFLQMRTGAAGSWNGLNLHYSSVSEFC